MTFDKANMVCTLKSCAMTLSINICGDVERATDIHTGAVVYLRLGSNCDVMVPDGADPLRFIDEVRSLVNALRGNS